MAPNDLITGFDKFFIPYIKVLIVIGMLAFSLEVAVLFAIVYGVLKLTGAM